MPIGLADTSTTVTINSTLPPHAVQAEPGNKIFPVSFVEACEKAFAGTGAELTVLDVPQMEALGMGALIGVGSWMRSRVSESPAYQAYMARRAEVARPAIAATLAAASETFVGSCRTSKRWTSRIFTPIWAATSSLASWTMRP